jgi:hypothetical protein
MSNPTKESLAKYLKLKFFNQYLYEKGIISRREYLLMTEQIRRRYPVD